MEIERVIVGPLQTNCYILKSGDQAVVIDPGAPDRRILEAVKGHQVRYILLTHAHFDHIGGVALLQEGHPEGELCLHHDEQPVLQHFAPELRPGCFLQDGDELEFGGESLQVWHTPGHSPGSVVFLYEHEGERVIFSGDLLFAGAIGRTDLPGGSPVAMERSLRRLLQLKGDYRVLPGHGPETTLAQERVSNPFLRELGELWLPERR